MPPRKVAIILPAILSNTEFKTHYIPDIDQEGTAPATTFITIGCMLSNCTLHDYLEEKKYKTKIYTADDPKRDKDFDEFQDTPTPRKCRLYRYCKPCKLYKKSRIVYYKTTPERDNAITSCDRII
jgi:hypothetical protein